MKKGPILTNCLLALMVLCLAGETVWARQGSLANRRLQGQGRIIGQRPLERKTRRQQGRLPRRPPILNPQLGRPGNARKLNKIQQRQRLMEAIGLNNDQRIRMEGIRRDNEDEAISIGRRIRQARNALDRAIMNPDYNEALIRARTEELAAAQADQVRFQARVRAAFRSVLTSEQVTKLRELEREANRLNREQKLREQRDQDQQTDPSGVRRPPLPPDQFDPIALLFPTLN